MGKISGIYASHYVSEKKIQIEVISELRENIV